MLYDSLKYLVFLLTILLINFHIVNAQEKNIEIISDSKSIISEVDSIINKYDTPKWVMYRSLAIPGLGQLYNKKIVKAVALFTISTVSLRNYFNYNIRLDNSALRIENLVFLDDNISFGKVYNSALDLKMQLELSEREYLKGKRNSSAWLFGVSILYGMIDAYVDAYLKDFDKDMDINVDNSNFKNTIVTIRYKIPIDNLFKGRKND